MIYSNYKLVEQGRLGSIKDYSFNPPQATKEPVSGLSAPTEQPEMAEPANRSDPAIFLGEVNGRVYRYFPDDFDMSQIGDQDPDIDFRQETELDESIRLALREQATCRFKKQEARDQIDSEVGDVLDLLADMGQLVEFAIIAVSAMCADRAGIIPLTDSTAKDYGLRGAAVLKAVADGQLMLRSSFETPEKMITTIMPRYSLVQKIVRDRYINPLKELGL